MSKSYPRLKTIKTVRSGKIRTTFGRGKFRRIKSKPFIEFESDEMPIDECLTPTQDIEWYLAHAHHTGEYPDDCLPVLVDQPDTYTIPDLLPPVVSQLVQTEQLTYQLFGEYTIRSPTSYINSTIPAAPTLVTSNGLLEMNTVAYLYGYNISPGLYEVILESPIPFIAGIVFRVLLELTGASLAETIIDPLAISSSTILSSFPGTILVEFTPTPGATISSFKIDYSDTATVERLTSGQFGTTSLPYGTSSGTTSSLADRLNGNAVIDPFKLGYDVRLIGNLISTRFFRQGSAVSQAISMKHTSLSLNEYPTVITGVNISNLTPGAPLSSFENSNTIYTMEQLTLTANQPNSKLTTLYALQPLPFAYNTPRFKEIGGTAILYDIGDARLLPPPPDEPE